MYIWDKASKTCLIVSRQNQFPSRDPGRDRQVAPCYEGGGSQAPQWVGLRGYGHLTRGGQGHNLGALRTDSGDVFCSHWRHHTATKFFETFAKLLSLCFLTVIRRETFIHKSSQLDCEFHEAQIRRGTTTEMSSRKQGLWCVHLTRPTYVDYWRLFCFSHSSLKNVSEPHHLGI